MRRSDRLTAFLMLLPSVVLLAIFVYGFIGRTAWVYEGASSAYASRSAAASPPARQPLTVKIKEKPGRQEFAIGMGNRKQGGRGRAGGSRRARRRQLLDSL